MKMADVKNLIYRYRRYRDQKSEPETFTALDGISLSVDQGAFVGIAGENGSGKSTLARHLCALLTPDSGKVVVFGRDTADRDAVAAIRRSTGMVFQNPDNQLIGATVEEDVAFGPENLGLEREEMERRIEEALASTGMSAYRLAAPGDLSGGQKQKIAVSGILAMEPDCIIFDEPTAMIDPASRRELAGIIRTLNKEKGITILYITHDLGEVSHADYIYIMKQGKICLAGKPGEVFGHSQALNEAGLSLPPALRLARDLREKGLPLPDSLTTDKQIADWLMARLDPGRLAEICRSQAARPAGSTDSTTRKHDTGTGLTLSHVSWTYPGLAAGQGTEVIKDVSLQLRPGEITVLAGPVGTGKSTLLMLLDGLLVPSEGSLLLDGEKVVEGGSADPSMMRKLHRKVGFCFQNPDYQLFEETVLKDVEFGPSNMGFGPEECRIRAEEALSLTGLSKEDWNKSPFFLSGGQKRRAALAGALATDPDYLLLDEPAAGLDGRGREGIFSLLKGLAKEKQKGILFVSHDMDEAARYGDRILLMANGAIRADGPAKEIMSDASLLKEAGLCLPRITEFMAELTESLLSENDREEVRLPVRIEEARDMILGAYRGDEVVL